MSNYPSDSTYNTRSLMETVDQDKKLLNRLRNRVLNLNKTVEEICGKDENVDGVKKKFKVIADQIQHDYDLLEADALNLQQHSLVSPEMNRLQTFLLEALSDPINNEIYNRAVKAASSYDTSNAYYTFAIEFLKIFTSSQPSRRPLKLTPQIYFNNQVNFEENLNKWIGAGKQNIFKVNFLERSACGSVVEVRIYHPSNVPTVGVVRIKMLFLVNNGLIEYIQMIAPHEKWSYRDANRTQIDIGVESKYECYRRLSARANAMAVTLSSYAQLDTKAYINSFLAIFIKLPMFEFQCKNCKRYLRDFMPALFDHRDRRACYHDSCR